VTKVKDQNVGEILQGLNSE